VNKNRLSRRECRIACQYLEHAVVDKSKASFDEDDVEYVNEITDVVDNPPVDAVRWRFITREVRHHTVRCHNCTVLIV